jgi:nicotinate-nucleotide pyrophosphorylase
MKAKFIINYSVEIEAKNLKQAQKLADEIIDLIMINIGYVESCTQNDIEEVEE